MHGTLAGVPSQRMIYRDDFVWTSPVVAAGSLPDGGPYYLRAFRFSNSETGPAVLYYS